MFPQMPTWREFTRSEGVDYHKLTYEEFCTSEGYQQKAKTFFEDFWRIGQVGNGAMDRCRWCAARRGSDR